MSQKAEKTSTIEPCLAAVAQINTNLEGIYNNLEELMGAPVAKVTKDAWPIFHILLDDDSFNMQTVSDKVEIADGLPLNSWVRRDSGKPEVSLFSAFVALPNFGTCFEIVIGDGLVDGNPTVSLSTNIVNLQEPSIDFVKGYGRNFAILDKTTLPPPDPTSSETDIDELTDEDFHLYAKWEVAYNLTQLVERIENSVA